MAQRGRRTVLKQLHSIWRHGDRAPVFNPMEGTSGAAAEEAVWASRVVRSVDPGIVARFPVHNANAHAFNHVHAPFGVLTLRGAAQAHERGLQLRKRYLPFLREHAAVASPAALMHVRASNHARTHITAQNLLSGLLLPNRPPVLQPVPIHIRPYLVDNIAAFEAGGGLLEAMKAVFASPLYMQREAQLRHISAALSDIIPYFRPTPAMLKAMAAAAGRSRMSDADPDPAERFPVSDHGVVGSKFMWIRAADYFQCYRENGLTLLDSALPFERAVHDQLLWRFRVLFLLPHIRRLAIGPLMADTLSNMLRRAAEVEQEPNTPVWAGMSLPPAVNEFSEPCGLPLHCVSGHDVTLLPYLLALVEASPRITAAFDNGRTQVVSNPQQALDMVRWPSYSANLTLELRRVEFTAAAAVRGAPAADAASLEPLDRWIVSWAFHNEKLRGQQVEGVDDDGVSDVEIAQSVFERLLQCADSSEPVTAAGATTATTAAAAAAATALASHPPPQPQPHVNVMAGEMTLRAFRNMVQRVMDVAA